MLETERLVLRRWEDSDAGDLYEYAKDPDVGPIAGWPPHQSIEESREVIKNVFTGREAYAVCLKTDGKTIGAIELKLNGYTDMTDRDGNDKGLVRLLRRQYKVKTCSGKMWISLSMDDARRGCPSDA